MAGGCAAGAASGAVGALLGGALSGRKPSPSEVGSAAILGCAIGAGGAALDSFVGSVLARASTGIWTPHGLATQGYSAGAGAALSEVRAGAIGYRTGAFGVQNTANGQFWSFKNPATTQGYGRSMGMPGGGAANDWIMGGTIKSVTSPVITRPAPGLGANSGGSMEFVTPPGGVSIDWFHMP